jgi:hypothetical protein
MAEELGRIERPSSDTFRAGRKLYVVPLIFAGEEAPQDFKDRCAGYWRQVDEQVAAQEAKVGNITRIYHESIALSGEEGLKVVERWNQGSHGIVKRLVERGAVLEATELADLADECMDWERCLLLGFFSRKAADTVAEHYRVAAKARWEYISRRMDETLKQGEVGVLFIREGHAVQYPQDLDVFMVAPPALDEIHRWLRDQRTGVEKEAAQEEAAQAGEPEKEEQPGLEEQKAEDGN